MQFVVRRRYVPPPSFRISTKIVRVVKWTTILLFISCLHVSASSYSQQVTLYYKNAPITEVLKAIQKQTGYSYFIKSDDLKKSKPVTIYISKTALETALDKSFEEQPLTYTIVDKAIIVRQKDVAVPKLSTQPTALLPLPPLRGWVLDTAGNPIAGATVMVKTGKQGTITTQDGSFNLVVQTGVTRLVISCVGYITQEIDVRNGEDLRIKLQPANSELDAMQIIAYGTTTKRLSTGNVSTVRSEVIAMQPVTNPLLALSGRVPGLQIVQSNGLPGSGVLVRIRGTNSITASNNPLYIVDGVPFTSEPVERNTGPQSAPTASGGSGNPLNVINPYDIESIEVLKDADATSIYGSRGANGVILITTKKGIAGKTEVSVDLNRGWSAVTQMPKTLSTEQYLQLRRDAFANSNVTPTATNAPDLTVWDQTTERDWQKWYIGNTANRTNVSTSVSGGNQQTSFFLSGNYHEETTIQSDNDKYLRGSGHLKVTHRSLDNKLQFNTSVLVSSDRNRLQNGIGGGFSTVAQTVPNYPVFDDQGNYNWVSGLTNYEAFVLEYYKSQTENLNTNVNISYQILNGLTIRGNVGYSSISMDQMSPSPAKSKNPSTQNLQSSSMFANKSIRTALFEPQLSFVRNVFQGKMELLAGMTIQQNQSKGQSMSVGNYTNDLLLESPGGGTVSSVGSDNIRYRYISSFGRLTYNWQNKYIVNGTFRRDGSSRFGPGKQFGNFGSMGAAWLFSNEKLLRKNPSILSYGKLRGSYGITGSDGIGDYRFLSTYQSAGDYGGVLSTRPSNIANPDFQWEVNRKLEIALDLGFNHDKILFNAAWYRNRSSNQLVTYPLPSTTGFSGYTANLPAMVQNSGFEFELTTNNIEEKNFKWNSSANASLPKNRLRRFLNIEATSYASTLVVGQSLNSVLGLKFPGVDPSTGNVLPFEDQNGKAGITYTSSYNNIGGDYVIIGNKDPKIITGLNNSISWNSFQLDIFFQYVRQDGYNLFREAAAFGQLRNMWEYFLDYWKQPGDVTSIPRPTSTSNSQNGSVSVSDAAFEDASFLRLKNISLAYSLIKSPIRNKGIQNLTLFLQGQNLWTITNRKIGFDPENATNTSLLIPLSKTLSMGLKCTL